MTPFYWRLDQAAKRILSAFSLALNLSPSDRAHLLSLHSGHNNQLRLLHYPAVEAAKLRHAVVGRMPAHQDWSSFTFVFQDGVGGLELEEPGRKGHFVPALPTVKGACVLNVGDMLQRFSNGASCRLNLNLIYAPLYDPLLNIHTRHVPISDAPCNATSNEATPGK